MRTQRRTLVFNAVLLLLLVLLFATTVRYQRIYVELLTSESRHATGLEPRLITFAEEVELHLQRHHGFQARHGKREHVTLPFYPGSTRTPPSQAVVLAPTKATAATTRGTDGQTAAGDVALPPENAARDGVGVVRLRSTIVAATATVANAGPALVGWRVQSERVQTSLFAPMLVSTPPPPPRPSPAPIAASVEVASAASTPHAAVEPRAIPNGTPRSSSHDSASQLCETDDTSAVSGTTARTVPAPPPRRANAVILLMCPTLSSDTVSTVVELGHSSPVVQRRSVGGGGGAQQPLQWQQHLPPVNETTSTRAAAPLPSTTHWRCRACQVFLQETLPQLETNYLRLYSYPVHIFHRGIMPSEVVQYITAVLPSAARLTIEDISGVLSETITPASAVAVEPWLKEMGSNLLHRKRAATAPPTPAPTPTPTPERTAAALDGVAGTAAEAPPSTAAGTAVNAERVTGDGTGITYPSGGGGGLGVEQEVGNAVKALRSNWEARRFWTGLLFLLPSLQSYDFFWFMESRARLTKPLARDVLAEVANKSCAVSYTHVSYLTHKRVPDLLSSLRAWNAQSGKFFFSREEIDRAVAWLSDDRPLYSGKVYSPDCIVFSFAVTRHPAYLDFFHWIDSRAPYALMKRQWSAAAVYTVMAELLMEKHGWNTCVLDPLSGYRHAEAT
ncbi:Glycolipid 2-alpha-mannosyltransferase [Novymonas esmeraldas]|uniref:Glycolipid 2-alpha-mannosyltransferase n=1 Tax=Novymonas esmeraldas TaxID=1808958 RepID=A0AAW0F3D8_9TRYP